MRGQGSELERRRTGYAENPRNCTFSMGGTLRGRFELPRALRPTRSQVWRVRPGFATSAASPLPESGNTLSRSVARGPKRPYVQLEGDHRLDERIGLENPGMDLAEPTDLVSLDHHGCSPARDEVPILDRDYVPRAADVPEEAEDQRLRLRERGLVMHRSGRDVPHVPRLDHDIRRFEDPLRQLAVFVASVEVEERREQSRTERGQVLPQRVDDLHPRRSLDRVLGGRDRQRHDLLVPVADE